jgi:hypothetical protein
MTPLTLEGSNLSTWQGFIDALAMALEGRGGYFGWDLHSLQDCLCGGYSPHPPPYHVVVDNAESFFEYVSSEASWVDYAHSSRAR